MKKIFSLLALVALIWLSKLSYDFYSVSKSLQSLQEDLRKSEQKNANLNDQLIAVQRQSSQEESSNIQKKQQASAQASPTGVVVQSPTVLKSQLELIQFAIQQRQFVFAFQKMNELDQSLDHYDLADALKAALSMALAQDKQNVQQLV